MGWNEMMAARLLCLVILTGFILTAGCLDETIGRNGQALVPVPAGFVEYRNEAQGWALAAPEGWNVQLVADTYLLAQDPNERASILIRPVYLGGRNAQASAIGLTSYTAGQVTMQHPDFTIRSIKKSADDSIVEVVGTYTASGVPMTVVMTTTLKDGSGLFVAYEAPSVDFATKEDQIRRIISTFTLTSPGIGSTPTPTLQLTELWPQVYPNPAFPQFPGGVKLRTPSGWVAYQQQADTCSINWWAAENTDLLTQTAVLSQFLVFKSEGAKSEQVSYWQMYGPSGQQYVALFQNIPVYENIGPESFLTGVLPLIGQTPALQKSYPNLDGISDVTITGTRPLDEPLKNLFRTQMNANAGSYDFTFMKNDIPMQGSAIVWATDFPGTPWWNGGMWYIFAPESEFTAKEQALIGVFESASVTPQWQQACTDVSQYQANVRQQVFEERQKSQDRIAEKWDDVILDRDRLYNPSTGEVYHVDVSFPDYYRLNRENFEMQNLQELPPGAWEQIPLDGRFYIR